jgi:predicted secreted protein
MSWLSIFAIYFILWWVVLFAMLPIGLRTQEEESDVTLGTTPSAPQGKHIGRAFLLTTVVSAVIFGVFYVVTVYWGWRFDDIPRIVPEFG